MLDKGAEVDRTESTVRRRCSPPAENGHVDAARLLLDKGAEVDRADWKALRLSSTRGCTIPPEVDRANNQRRRRAAMSPDSNGHVDAALLLDKGAEVDRATEDGWTPLFVACQNGHVDAARLLLDKGDVRPPTNQTPLHGRTEFGEDVAALANGADVAAKTSGKYAMEYARCAIHRGCCWTRRCTSRSVPGERSAAVAARGRSGDGKMAGRPRTARLLSSRGGRSGE